ncbi:MAG: EAL domain-containing protein [Lachnospiraceae bacterium]
MKCIHNVYFYIFIILGLLLFPITSFASTSSTSSTESIDYSILQQKEVYRVGYSHDHSPFSYTNADGEASGMAIDIMDYIADIADIQVSYVALYNDSDYSDLDISLSILNMDQLEDTSITSIPYFNFQMMLLGFENQFDYSNATIGHLDYSSLSNNIVENSFLGCNSQTYESYEALADSFETGDIDFMLISNLIAQETKPIEESDDTAKLLTTVTLDATLKFSNDLDESVVDTFNALIDSIDDDIIYNLILSAAINASNTELTPIEFLCEHTLIIVIAIFYFIAFILFGVFIYMTNKRKAVEKLLNIDDLTGLMTEHNFITTVTKILKNSKPEQRFYIISYDIDNFKYINELYNYELGTKTIKQFADTISKAFGAYECMARPFADNLLIFTKIPAKNGNICGQEVCSRCLDQCVSSLLGPDYKLMTSAGIYEITDKTLPVPYMIDCANTAKDRGKGTYKRTELVFTDELAYELSTKNDIITSMERGLLDSEFIMYYQPKVLFDTTELVGAEALVRWFREDGKQFYPDQFISLFEDNGFISRLDYYVFRSVSEFIVAHPETPKISVNISGKTFLEDEMLENIKNIILDTGVLVEKLEIEVTESAIVNNFEVITEKILQLKELGLTISMDDFGAGLSSLNRLKDLSIDVLKIDKEFLRDHEIIKKGESIIESIIDMAKKIGLTTVAEGVETIEQVTLLKELSCDIAQGYFYAKPLPEIEFLKFIQNENETSKERL